MMELYQEKVRNFLKLFPKELQSSKVKDAFYEEKSSYQALLRDKFITYNSSDRINIIAIDIDSHRDGGIWLDYDLPQPTWTIWTDRGVQLMWVLRKPILARVPEHRKMAKEVLARLVYALDADINAMGFNRVFRNPLNNKSYYADTRVDLKDFYLKLPKPSQEWWDKVKKNNKHKKKSKTETLFADTHAPAELKDFGTMKEGDGRNVALFDRLRFWAYDEAKAGRYDGHLLSSRALALNKAFLEPLDEKEVNVIINSIDNFMEFKYSAHNLREFGMSEEQIKEKASNAGKKSGKVRKMKSDMKIQATITQMQSFDIKITVSDVARRAGVERPRAREYLKENGWKEVSRKEGWVKQ
jgi:hypothetical protein